MIFVRALLLVVSCCAVFACDFFLRTTVVQETGGQTADGPPGNVRLEGHGLQVDVALRGRSEVVSIISSNEIS